MSHSVTKKRENHRKVAEYSNTRAYSETGPQSTRNSHLDAAALGVPSRENLGQPTQGDKQICWRQKCLLVRLPNVRPTGTPSNGRTSGVRSVGSRRVS